MNRPSHRPNLSVVPSSKGRPGISTTSTTTSTTRIGTHHSEGVSLCKNRTLVSFLDSTTRSGKDDICAGRNDIDQGQYRHVHRPRIGMQAEIRLTFDMDEYTIVKKNNGNISNSNGDSNSNSNAINNRTHQSTRHSHRNSNLKPPRLYSSSSCIEHQGYFYCHLSGIVSSVTNTNCRGRIPSDGDRNANSSHIASYGSSWESNCHDTTSSFRTRTGIRTVVGGVRTNSLRAVTEVSVFCIISQDNPSSVRLLEEAKLRPDGIYRIDLITETMTMNNHHLTQNQRTMNQCHPYDYQVMRITDMTGRDPRNQLPLSFCHWLQHQDWWIARHATESFDNRRYVDVGPGSDEDPDGNNITNDNVSNKRRILEKLQIPVL